MPNPPRKKKRIDLVLSGSGTLFPCHIGAVCRLTKEVTIARVSGTSGGGLVAAAIAAGWSTKRMMDLSKQVLHGNMLDRSWWPFDRIGLHNGNKIHRLLATELPGRLADMDIPWGATAVDLWTRSPVFLSSADYPNMAIADLLRATMSIPFWFKATKIPGMGDHLYVDGGISENLPMGVWDNIPTRPTIGIRFQSSIGKSIPAKNTKSQVEAVLSSMLDAANHTHISKKHWAHVVSIQTKGNGMDFDLTSKEVDKLYQDGWNSMDRALLKGDLAL